jgi:hypothetical protein
MIGTSFPANQYPIEFSINNIQQGVTHVESGSTVPANGIVVNSTGANDTVYVDAALDYPLTSFSCSGMTTAAVASGSASSAACIKQNASPAAQSTTLNWTGSIHATTFMAIFRTVASASLQQLNECQGDSPVNCQFLFPITADDNVKAMVPIRNGGYTLVDTTGGNVGSLLPAILNGTDLWQFENISAIQPTFTLSGVNVQNPDSNLILTEWKGEAASHSYVDGVSNWDAPCTYGHGCPNLSYSSTPVHILQAGSYNLVSTVTDFPGETIVGPTGFTPIFINLNDGGQLAAVYNQHLVTTGPATAVSTPSWSVESSAPQVGLWAFGQAPNLLPHVVQTTASNGAFGTTVPFPNALQASGSIIIVNTCSLGGWGSSFGITTSSGTPTVIRGGTTSDDFQTVSINNPTGGGNFSITPTSTGGGRMGMVAFEVWPVLAVQGANSETCGVSPAPACSPSLTGHTGNVTTTNPTSIVLSFGCVTSDTTLSLITSTDSTYSLTQQLSGQNIGYSGYSKTVLTPGIWSNTFTSPTVTQFFDGIIVPLTAPTILSNVQPNVTVITENRVKDWFREGAQ